ncbi:MULTISPECIES: DUF4193 domain-containing protein [Corynebacterium]|uniref:DUF4193 domain-containing protein n=1 Tax=Corynebacterium freneyi TaxID=134034 RepID=A0ABS4U7K6_9CORY|nr:MULTISPECIES: DUF4193 domain-containing protein [Corynebacterium]MBP2332640.1 hypothetical protein [Corynebacterium freneyi]MCG7438699.1 DUF4193 domain-containing protein [Corynebacterium freneyi]OFU57182.1 hypothetical protein HMPREF3121_03705 [Corynebacterium sp. HMSC11E11]QXA53202.1 DUF4193 domain-containing protein [Corynebacterium freneyi]UBI01175.1 DUF4193 domain-containing protein [Corynebacterium freneyi]
MAVDYDSPRTREEEDIATDSLEGLQAASENNRIADDDDGEIVEPYELPGADLSGEELEISVVPRQDDEFTCGSCFLVQHRSMMAHDPGDGFPICRDCA